MQSIAERERSKPTANGSLRISHYYFKIRHLSRPIRCRGEGRPGRKASESAPTACSPLSPEPLCCKKGSRRLPNYGFQSLRACHTPSLVLNGRPSLDPSPSPPPSSRRSCCCITRGVQGTACRVWVWGEAADVRGAYGDHDSVDSSYAF